MFEWGGEQRTIIYCSSAKALEMAPPWLHPPSSIRRRCSVARRNDGAPASSSPQLHVTATTSMERREDDEERRLGRGSNASENVMSLKAVQCTSSHRSQHEQSKLLNSTPTQRLHMRPWFSAPAAAKMSLLRPKFTRRTTKWGSSSRSKSSTSTISAALWPVFRTTKPALAAGRSVNILILWVRRKARRHSFLFNV